MSAVVKTKQGGHCSGLLANKKRPTVISRLPSTAAWTSLKTVHQMGLKMK